MVKLKKVNSYIESPAKSLITEIDKASYDLDLAMNLLRIKDGISFDELKRKNIYISKSFKEKILEGVSRGLLEKDTIKATAQGYKFLNDTVNLFN
jgi:oxygen-independent coproporphyrinogen-3 oxidase